MVAELTIRMGCVQPVQSSGWLQSSNVISGMKAVSIALAVPVAIAISGIAYTGNFALRKIPVRRTSP